MLSFVSFLLPIASALPSTNVPTQIGRIDIPNVAFAKIIQDTSNHKSLYFTTFSGNPFAKNTDKVLLYSDASFALQPKVSSPTTIEGSLTWPNEVTYAPSSVFGQDGVVVAGGFLVPGKSNGGIWFSTHGQEWINLFTAKNYFYHRVRFFDVDGDGQLDILTCRATKPLFGPGTGNLVYLKPEDSSRPMGPWKETVVGPHCDTFFEIADLNGDGKDDIISAEFWGNSLTMISSTNPKNSFANPKDLVYNVIDSHDGHIFDVQLVDLNGDGKKDVLVTNHQGNKEAPHGSVYGYEVPQNIKDPWPRHLLATNFTVLQKGFAQASPGSAQAFYPVQGNKPLIALAGDGSQRAYVLEPNSQDASDWSYNTRQIHDCKSTVGSLAIDDVNDDGHMEIFIPCYDAGYVAVYAY